MIRAHSVLPSLRATRNRLLMLLTTFALLLVCLTAGAQSEREMTKRTSWWWYHNASPEQITSLIATKSARLISIRVDTTAPLTFTVTMVKNTGDYAKGWWWYYSLTPEALATRLQQKNARLLDMDPYVVNGQLYFAVIMVPKDGTGWGYYYGIAGSRIGSLLQQNNARLLSLRSYIQDGQRLYAVVMIKNTGSNARSWWYYYNVPMSQIQSFLNTGASKRLIALQRNDVGNYNAIFLANSGTNWWYYYGISPDTALTTYAINRVARIIDAQTYTVNGQQYYLGLMIQN